MCGLSSGVSGGRSREGTRAVTAGGRVYTWGDGGFDQLGHGDTDSRLVPTLVGAGAFGGSAVVMAACGSFHTLVVTRDGALWVCGSGRYGRLVVDAELPMQSTPAR